MQFNVKKKISPGQQKILQDKTVFLMDNEIGSKNLQVLLNKNRTLVIDVDFVAAVFMADPSDLRAAIRVEPVGDGFVAFVDDSIFQKVKVLRCQVRQIRQMDQVKPSRWPQLDRMEGDECSYGSRSSAVMGLLLHLLTNVKRRTGKSWTFKMLKHTKELVIIVPVTKNKTTLEIVCTLFRNDNIDGTKVMCRHFDQVGKSYRPFEVSTDNDGYFNNESNEDG